MNNIEHFVHKHLCCPPFLLTDHISYQPSIVRSCLIKYLQNRIFVRYWGIYSGKIGYIKKNKSVEQRRLQLKKILRKNSINRDYERGEEFKQWAIFGNTWELVTKNMFFLKANTVDWGGVSQTGTDLQHPGTDSKKNYQTSCSYISTH